MDNLDDESADDLIQALNKLHMEVFTNLNLLNPHPIPLVQPITYAQSDRWKFAATGFIANPIGLHNNGALKRNLEQQWGLGNPVEMADRNGRLVYFRFENEKDLEWVLYEGPWQASGRRITFQRWKPYLAACEADYYKIPMWIQISGLPMEHYRESDVIIAARAVGQVIQTDMVKREHDSIPFIRAKILKELNSPIVQETDFKVMGVGENSISFRYETTGVYCHLCGILDHRKEQCPATVEVWKAWKNLLQGRALPVEVENKKLPFHPNSRIMVSRMKFTKELKEFHFQNFSYTQKVRKFAQQLNTGELDVGDFMNGMVRFEDLEGVEASCNLFDPAPLISLDPRLLLKADQEMMLKRYTEEVKEARLFTESVFVGGNFEGEANPTFGNAQNEFVTFIEKQENESDFNLKLNPIGLTSEPGDFQEIAIQVREEEGVQHLGVNACYDGINEGGMNAEGFLAEKVQIFTKMGPTISNPHSNDQPNPLSIDFTQYPNSRLSPVSIGPLGFNLFIKETINTLTSFDPTKISDPPPLLFPEDSLISPIIS